MTFIFPDIAIVTSLRDGMNLVSYEFVACQDAKRGVLILSEVTIGTVNLSVIAFIICKRHVLMLSYGTKVRGYVYIVSFNGEAIFYRLYILVYL